MAQLYGRTLSGPFSIRGTKAGEYKKVEKSPLEMPNLTQLSQKYCIKWGVSSNLLESVAVVVKDFQSVTVRGMGH